MRNAANNSNGLKPYIFKLLSKYKFYVGGLALVALLAGIFEISVDYKIKELIDTISGNQKGSINRLIFLFIIYKLLYHGIYFVSRLLNIKYYSVLVQQIVTDIYHKISHHSLHWFDSHLSGEISNKISDLQNGFSNIVHYLFKSFNIIVTIAISLLFLAQVHILTAVVLLTFIAVYAPLIYFLLKKQIKLHGETVDAKQETMGIINDSITNMFSVKVIGNLSSEYKNKLKPSLNRWKTLGIKTNKFDAYWVDNADTMTVVLMNAVQISLLAHLYLQGEITAGGFAFIAMMTLKLHTELGDFLENLLFNITPSIAQIKSSYSFVNSPIDVKDSKKTQTISWR